MASQVEDIKYVPGTRRRFVVDGFKFADPARSDEAVYFLTHFHSDHTVGLTRHFKGTIYASQVTCDLLVHDFRLKLKAPPSSAAAAVGAAAADSGGGGGGAVLVPLPLNERVIIDGGAGVGAVGVTAIDANHCPGAVMLLFEVPRGGDGGDGSGGNGGGKQQQQQQQQPSRTLNVLHTGDFRWQDWMASDTPLATARVDTLMLDTTYCLPRYTFPPQQEAVRLAAAACREELAREPDTLIVCSSYHIGKERAFFGVAEALGGVKVFVTPHKLRTLRLLQLPRRWMDLITTDPLEAGVHVVSGGGALHPARLLERYGLPLPPPPPQGGSGGGGGGGGGSGPAADDDGDDDLAEEDGDGGGGSGGGLRSGSRGGGGGRGASSAADEEDAEQENAAATAVAGASRWKAVLALRATGWSFRKKGGLSRWRLGAATVLGVPYSEHSSFLELQACVKALRPFRIIPTVNAPDAAASRAIVERFVGGMDLSRDRSRLDAYFSKAAAPAAAANGASAAPTAKGASAAAAALGGGSSGSKGGGSSSSGSKCGGGSGGLEEQGDGKDEDDGEQGRPREEGAEPADADLEQQRRMLAEFERVQRLRRSLASLPGSSSAAAAAAASAAKRKKRRCSSNGAE